MALKNQRKAGPGSRRKPAQEAAERHPPPTQDFYRGGAPHPVKFTRPATQQHRACLPRSTRRAAPQTLSIHSLPLSQVNQQPVRLPQAGPHDLAPDTKEPAPAWVHARYRYQCSTNGHPPHAPASEHRPGTTPLPHCLHPPQPPGPPRGDPLCRQPRVGPPYTGPRA